MLQNSASAVPAVFRFVRNRPGPVLIVSALLLAPCFWHKRIEAGDLASHTYNAWLAQLIERGQAPGLYLVWQSNNVLVDLGLAKLGKVVGLAAAERIVVSACVLIFFWGSFAFIAAATRRAPWTLVPAVAMIAYGWTFQMGFLNFYLAIGLAFFAIALFWRGRRTDWVLGAVLAALTFLAHPLGFLWLAAASVYLKLADELRGWHRWMLFGLALLSVVAMHHYVLHLRTEYWDTPFFYLLNGANQLALFGNRYSILAAAVFLLGSFCFVYGMIREWKTEASRWRFRTVLELWAVLVLSAALIPEVVWLPQYAAPVGMIVVRFTTVTAVLGLCILGWIQPKLWHLTGFAACALIFFVWIYQDTAVLNKMEQQAEDMTRRLPYGRRVLATIWAPPESNIYFINHMVDRACIGRCFTYANYEPSSGQFRIRVQPGSPVTTDDPDASEQMESGDYVVQPADLPMTQIYQCDDKNLAGLCMRDLQAGEVNGRLGYHPPK